LYDDDDDDDASRGMGNTVESGFPPTIGSVSDLTGVLIGVLFIIRPMETDGV
jgi:hypothetical protein